MAFKAAVKLMIHSGQAKPSPAIGQALGPLGLNMAAFCKEFNDRTANMIEGVPTPTILTAKTDRTFTFETKTAPTTWFIKRCVNVSHGANMPGREEVAELPLKAIYEIAKVKQQDMEHLSLESIARMVSATAKSMGIRTEQRQPALEQQAAAEADV